MFGYVASIQSSEDCGLRVWGLKFRICRGFYVTGAMHHRRLPCFSLRLASVVVRCYVHNILVLAVAGLLSFGRLYAVLLWVVKFLVQLIEGLDHVQFELVPCTASPKASAQRVQSHLRRDPSHQFGLPFEDDGSLIRLCYATTSTKVQDSIPTSL